MQKFIRNGIVCLLLLSPVFCRAKTPVTHEFSDMSIPSELKFSNSNKVAKTDLLTYTCSGSNAAFGQDLYNASGSKKISINLKGSDDIVTTTAIDSLASIQVWHYPASECRNIRVNLSRDSVHWITIEQDSMEYSTTYLKADFVPGRYYVKLTHTNSTKVSLWKIKYTFGDCNCQLYIPEEVSE